VEGSSVVRRGLLIVGVISIAMLCGTAVRADILIGLAGPITGKEGWYGAQLERGAALAVADLNAAGGVLGQQVELITADDFCDPEQAVAAAKKLVSDEVVFVVGHYCSGASIPASQIYEAGGVLMISPTSSNPMLTELGRANVFRIMYRDDATGMVAGNYLADHWSDQKIAILHDDTVYGRGLAEETKKQLNRRGVTEVVYQAYAPGKNNYGAEIDLIQDANIAVLYVGGYPTEIALMARAARDRDYPLQVVTGMTLASEDFGLIAGGGADGTHFIDNPDPRERVEAAPLVERFRASGFEPEGYTLHAYAAVQVWAQAAEQAGSLALEAMIETLRQHQFDTVLGPIDFDDKGDLTVQNPVWYVWRNDTYQPLEPSVARQ
jgi:branched-chain amino acid transport system substrate-binding protein